MFLDADSVFIGFIAGLSIVPILVAWLLTTWVISRVLEKLWQKMIDTREQRHECSSTCDDTNVPDNPTAR